MKKCYSILKCKTKLENEDKINVTCRGVEDIHQKVDPSFLIIFDNLCRACCALLKCLCGRQNRVHLAEKAANLMWYCSEARLFVIIRSNTSFSSYPIPVLKRDKNCYRSRDPALLCFSLEQQTCQESGNLIIQPLGL